MKRSQFYAGWGSKGLLLVAVTMLTTSGIIVTELFGLRETTVLWVIAASIVAISLQGLMDLIQELEETNSVLREIRDNLERR